MRKLTLALGLTLAAGLPAARDEEADAKAAADAIRKQANDAGGRSWDDLAGAGKGLADKHKLPHVMHLFKPRRPNGTGGLGVGDRPGAVKSDGIERKIMELAREAPGPEVLARDGPALARMAEVSAAIASVAVHQCPVTTRSGDKDPAKWKEWSEETYRQSLELARAVRAKKPAAVKAAAGVLNGACVDCHRVFRD